MLISELIEQLENVQAKHGDIEVSVTASMLDDGFSESGFEQMPDVFESTCENLIVLEQPVGNLNEKRVRLYF